MSIKYQACKLFILLCLLLSSNFLIQMAASEHSSTDDALENLQEETSKESKLEFSDDEEALIIRMYNLVGERWALIAGRIPGRTAEEIEKYWTATYSTSE